jgi:hypothetical protein
MEVVLRRGYRSGKDKAMAKRGSDQAPVISSSAEHEISASGRRERRDLLYPQISQIYAD